MHKEPPSALSSSWGAARLSVRFQGVTEQKPAQHAHLLKLSLSFCFHRLALPCIPPARDASLARAAVSSGRPCFIQHQLPHPQHWQLLFFWFLSDLSSLSDIPPSGPPPKVTPQNRILLFCVKSRPGIRAKIKSDPLWHGCTKVFFHLSLGLCRLHCHK